MLSSAEAVITVGPMCNTETGRCHLLHHIIMCILPAAVVMLRCLCFNTDGTEQRPVTKQSLEHSGDGESILWS